MDEISANSLTVDEFIRDYYDFCMDYGYANPGSAAMKRRFLKEWDDATTEQRTALEGITGQESACGA